MMQELTPLNTALAYNAAAIPIFPCRAKEEIDPHTGEALAPKTPYTSNGLRGASTNTRIIQEWWRRTPDAMVGMPTGRPLNAWVLDLDIKPGVGDGHEWLAAMEDLHGPLPETARAKTMGGGTHIFFRHVDGVRNRGRLGLCVDVRGDGGYVIAPGSRAIDGRSYEWIDWDGEGLPPIADAPDWLLELVLPSVAKETRYDYSYTPGENEPYIEAAVKHELDSLADAAPGGRGYALNESAFKLGTLVGAGALSRSEAEAGLYDAARACGVLAKDGDRETWAKIRRGLDAGQRNPRQIPESQQDNTRLVDISRMIANGLAKAERAKQDHVNSADNKPDATPDDNPSEESTQTSDSRDDGKPAAFTATPFKWIDPATLARREFAYGTHYIRKYASVTVSPGGLGKTSNSIAEALAMASGKALIGVKPPQRMRVWLFNAEDPRDEMERRIMAACLHYNLKPEDVEGYLFLDTGREQELVIARDDKRTGVKIIEPVVESIVEQINANRIDVKIVDPFVSTHQVNENDNGAIDKVAKLWAQIADKTNTAIDIVHHLRKVADREATVEDARGAVALIGAARSVRVLNRMSEDQATAAGIPKDDRFSYFNVHQGKANLTRLSSALDWRRLESVPLGNGRGLAKPQDHAGVVTEWKWPGAEEIAATVTDEQMAEIVRLVDNGQYKEGNRAKDWAGKAVAFALGVDIEDDNARQRCAALLKALLKEGALVKSEEKDPVRRETAVFVRSAGWSAR